MHIEKCFEHIVNIKSALVEVGVESVIVNCILTILNSGTINSEIWNIFPRKIFTRGKPQRGVLLSLTFFRYQGTKIIVASADDCSSYNTGYVSYHHWIYLLWSMHLNKYLLGSSKQSLGQPQSFKNIIFLKLLIPN